MDYMNTGSGKIVPVWIFSLGSDMSGTKLGSSMELHDISKEVETKLLNVIMEYAKLMYLKGCIHSRRLYLVDSNKML